MFARGIHPVRASPGRAPPQLCHGRPGRGDAANSGDRRPLPLSARFPCDSSPRSPRSGAKGGGASRRRRFGAAEKYRRLKKTASGGGPACRVDGVEDPHNLGAIIRTAHAPGAAAIVIPGTPRVGLTGPSRARPPARGLSAGRARRENIRHALEDLKSGGGYWMTTGRARQHRYDRVG